jgi:amphi-Trp domain-containing protein
MAENVQKEFRLEREDAAELLRDIADALEEEDQLNIDFEEEKLIQPLSGKVPLRIFQDENGTEIGYKLLGD